MMQFKHYITLLMVFTVCAKNWFEEKRIYNLNASDPIDVLIACHEKDQDVLQLCIQSAKKHVQNVRRIIVASDRRLSDDAEWYDESLLSFSKKSISDEFSSLDPSFKTSPEKQARVGWYFKQILNFYAPFEIPNISSNVLILDADTVLLRTVTFVDEEGNMLHAPGAEYHIPYFEHMQKFLPGLKRVFHKLSGISHHMLFQRAVLEDLFNLIESRHNCKFWQAYCRCVDIKDIALAGAADYEIYFNFVLQRSNQIKIRPLKWTNINQLSFITPCQEARYHFVSCHHWTRKDLEKK
ncbi:TPA: hypothetical protein DIC20_03820 [Candidatus Dependentiae bacterium]|nr:MAG: hypothetical protein US03_C0001G0151 [candidate division TM6 bacterium GW2011_GWF2_36_131]KKQ03713.1 MAG: hypothetical protein US13_C0001G0053 [candidate division TM6 bacterium GW2011_GWE2_36_25]KKQ20051.1 MAG: hypothetical protein US32_C0002G0056 [candidate division TM6 bacterium GW2011_GWA2_36_9]HCU00804.1 hypothetical protein [Candidatus Dependentiae bacterium]